MQKQRKKVAFSSVVVTVMMIALLQVINVLSLVEKTKVEDKVVASVSEDTTVENSADGVEFSKNVEFTTYKGKERDEAGNPYVKVQLKLDATSANDKVLNYTENTRSTDVVLMLDTSSSMKGKKFESEKKAAMNFVSKLMEQGDNIRLSVIRFDTKVEVLGTFSDSKQNIHKAITEISHKDLGSLTDLQGAVLAGQRELKRSNATNKVMILLTDGEPNVFYGGETADEMASNDAFAFGSYT
jgi:Mg-chelatase subunit ChlD